MSYFRYLCFFAYSGVSCVASFSGFSFFLLSLRHSLTFTTPQVPNHRLHYSFVRSSPPSYVIHNFE